MVHVGRTLLAEIIMSKLLRQKDDGELIDPIVRYGDMKFYEGDGVSAKHSRLVHVKRCTWGMHPDEAKDEEDRRELVTEEVDGIIEFEVHATLVTADGRRMDVFNLRDLSPLEPRS